MNINPASHILLFDIDETLANSGASLTAEMANTLDYLQNVQGYQIAYATARSYSELEIRMPVGGQHLLTEAYAFTCLGMEFWHQAKMQYQHYFKWPEKMDTLLRTLLNSAACNCPHKTGKHIFKRPSTGAFSPLGDGATEEQRAEFIAWNQQSDFLAKSVEIIKQYYPKLDVQVFGKTTIDFSNKAMSKACVLSELRQFENKNIVFFGDNMQVGGNDRPLAEALLIESAKNMAITVKNPAETLQYLYNIKHNGAV